jgi:hypothetical protein
MAIIGVHLGFGPQTRVVRVQAEGGRVTRKIVAQHLAPGECLKGVIGRHRGELTPAKADQILSMRGEIAGFGVSAPIDLGLLFAPNSNMVAMAREVTIGQMRLFVEETNYQPVGHSSGKFKKLLKNGAESDIMVYTNETDCLIFAKWALSKVQAQDPRIQTLGLPSNEKWSEMMRTFRGQQTGQHWERVSEGFFRSFRYDVRYHGSQEERFNFSAFRLVGTYQKVTPHVLG